MRQWLKSIFLPMLGLSALSLIIWFVGPLFTFAAWIPLEHPYSRGFLILLVWCFWIYRKIRKQRLTRQANQQLAEQVVEVDEAGEQTREEVQLLKEKLQEALDILKTAKLGGRSGDEKSLYEIPWYIIIGPPGSGKTTALINCGLNFPLAKKLGINKLKGVGGTRHCDWWFTDEAVLIDTAGRYTTQDSNQAQDSAAWTGFLGLLKKYRKRRPINGAFVAISVAELLAQSDAERQRHSRIIRERINELQSELGIRFPVYVLLTKCDLMAGFNEFFDDLGRDQREQVWGMTFQLSDLNNDNPAGEQFAPEFDALEQRLSSMILERLEYERAPQRRSLIYAFPQQFTALKSLLEPFLNDIFRPTRYQESAILRGVYFTSATQEGNPIDRIFNSLARTFGLGAGAVQPVFSGRGRSYFLTRLLRHVVFEEAGLAGTNLREEKRRAWIQRAAYAGCVLLLGIGLITWGISYQGNQGYITTVNTSVVESDDVLKRLYGHSSGYATILPALDSVQAIPGGYLQVETDIPWSMGFGLYQGTKLGREARNTYRRLLHNLMLPHMIYQLEDRLRRSSENKELLYETLKVYLMLDDPSHLDIDAAQAWFELDWQLVPPRSLLTGDMQDLGQHLHAILTQLEQPLSIDLDKDLIESARRELRRVPMAKRILGRLKLESRFSDKAPDFRIDEAAGSGADLVFTRRSGKPLSEGLMGLFTYRGYTKIYKPESRRIAVELLAEKWVLGDLESIEDLADVARETTQVLKQVQRLYFDEYIDIWKRLLDDLQVRPFANLAAAVDLLNEISAPSSPMRKILVAVADETALAKPTKSGDAAKKVLDAGANRMKTRLARLLPGNPRTGRVQLGDSIKDPGEYVEDEFTRLAELVAGDTESRLPVDRLLRLLDELYAYVDGLAMGGANATSGANTPIRRLRLEGRRMPHPVRGWMESMAIQTEKLAVGGVMSNLDQQWISQVVPSCMEIVNQRFPFSRSGRVEVTLTDFGKLFGHGGLIDRFFTDKLIQYADIGSSPWRWKPRAANAPNLSPQSIRAFEIARQIRDSFFQNGGQTPKVQFNLTPLFLDDSVDQFSLNLEGQKIGYRHGPIRPTRVQWPGSSEFPQVTLQMDPPSNRGRSALIYDGPWAWFRLIDESLIDDKRGAESFVIRFNIDGREAHYRLTANSVVNPFQTQALEQFSCPGSL